MASSSVVDFAGDGGHLDCQLSSVSGLQPADVTHDVGGAGCRVLSRSGAPPEIRYSMIVFNWFGVSLIPILALIVLQVRRMAHRTPIFSYALLGCAAGSPACSLSPTCVGCWPPSARKEAGADSTVQRFRLDNLHHSGPLSHRAERNSLRSNLFRRSPRPVFSRWVAYSTF